ncbi:MAG: hypothetical protein Q9191_002291, partial [Dirinaria sp. TL-2023a]
MPGSVGIVAKSGTLSYEAVASTTRVGLGQSLVIGMGGDILPGTDFVDALRVFEMDDETKGIILIGEIGGGAEEKAARWIKDYRERHKTPKPIMALVAGMQAVAGRIMGHSGAFIGHLDGDAQHKSNCLADAGAVLTNHPSKCGTVMRELLEKSSTRAPSSGSASAVSAAFQPFRRPLPPSLKVGKPLRQDRNFVTNSKGHELLKEIDLTEFTMLDTPKQLFLGVSIDRENVSPRVYATLVRSEKYPYFGAATASAIAGMSTIESERYSPWFKWEDSSQREIKRDPSLNEPILKLLALFYSREMYFLETWWTPEAEGPGLKWIISKTRFGFDDSAHKSSNRQEHIHRGIKQLEAMDLQEAMAENHGIVYIKYSVNGAGLAMNTNDVLTSMGGPCSNFLDTGGKATAETVKASFQIILQDPRVRTIFVNIFGGLTLCDMIAEGIMLAYRDLGIQVPVVVRLRGTNEEIGQRM